MKSLIIKTIVKGNYKDVFNRFDRELFEALKPPGLNLILHRFDGCHKGDEIHLEVGGLGLKSQWVSLITANYQDDNECFFIDEGKILPKPLSYWRHRHVIERLTQDTCVIIDDITYACHGGSIVELSMWPILWTQFSMRSPIYRRYF